VARGSGLTRSEVPQSLNAGMPHTNDMDCIVCKNLERDVNDIQRKTEELMIDQRKVKTASEKENTWFEITALSASRSEVEGRYLKHRKSFPHQKGPL
jgi:hypothetical protein